MEALKIKGASKQMPCVICGHNTEASDTASWVICSDCTVVPGWWDKAKEIIPGMKFVKQSQGERRIKSEKAVGVRVPEATEAQASAGEGKALAEAKPEITQPKKERAETQRFGQCGYMQSKIREGWNDDQIVAGLHKDIPQYIAEDKKIKSLLKFHRIIVAKKDGGVGVAQPKAEAVETKKATSPKPKQKAVAKKVKAVKRAGKK